jgi:hypothetical protein
VLVVVLVLAVLVPRAVETEELVGWEPFQPTPVQAVAVAAAVPVGKTALMVAMVEQVVVCRVA